MKKIVFILGILLVSLYSQAQDFDQYWKWMFQELKKNDRELKENMEKLQQLQQETIDKNMSVNAYILPCNTPDCFYAFVILSHPSVIDKITMFYYSKEDFSDMKIIGRSECSIYAQHVDSPKVLKPGYNFGIMKNKDNKDDEEKIMFFGEIPEKGTSEYETFKEQAADNKQTIYNILNPNTVPNTVPNYSAPGTTSYQVKCSYCNGTGISPVATSVATYGNTDMHWCDVCKKSVSAGHGYHGSCSSCSGKGYITKTR
ncbi:MAG: hypothetical protein LBT50_04240 [Prevotellaceae bacterium]|jgi:hypothetical protein|nr:hypothetical protein [Prevotellaceae bacterium]